MDTSTQATELIPVKGPTGATGKRQYRTVQEKLQIVEETLAEGASVAWIARAHGINANQLGPVRGIAGLTGMNRWKGRYLQECCPAGRADFAGMQHWRLRISPCQLRSSQCLREQRDPTRFFRPTPATLMRAWT